MLISIAELLHLPGNKFLGPEPMGYTVEETHICDVEDDKGYAEGDPQCVVVKLVCVVIVVLLLSINHVHCCFLLVLK